MYLKKSPRINYAKINEVVFVGPQIRESIGKLKFEGQLSEA
jgi:hypothetical protein